MPPRNSSRLNLYINLKIENYFFHALMRQQSINDSFFMSLHNSRLCISLYIMKHKMNQ